MKFAENRDYPVSEFNDLACCSVAEIGLVSPNVTTHRQKLATSLIDDLEARLHSQLTQISGKSGLAGAIRYGLTRLKRLRPYLNNGRLSIDNNAAERGMRSIALAGTGIIALNVKRQ